jgi:hypothetical protein
MREENESTEQKSTAAAWLSEGPRRATARLRDGDTGAAATLAHGEHIGKRRRGARKKLGLGRRTAGESQKHEP